MSRRVQRHRNAPDIEGPLAERWRGPDRGLIVCWEVGRRLRLENPKLAERAANGELPVLGWKGGVEEKIKKRKYGTLNYLAQWQALRGEDLDIDFSQEYVLTCSRTGMTVIYTREQEKWGQP